MLDDIKGIGPKTLSLLQKLGIYSIDDLVNYYPYRYNVLNVLTLEVFLAVPLMAVTFTW